MYHFTHVASLAVASVVFVGTTMTQTKVADWWGKTDEGQFLKVRWDDAWGYRTKNDWGVTGWAKIIRSGGDEHPEGEYRRFHRCFVKPCKSRWKADKHGVWGPPIHLEPVDEADVSFGPAPPAPPESAALRQGCCVPKAVPFDPPLATLKSCKSAVADPTVDGSAVADPTYAKLNVFTTIMALSREISTPASYVGYSFFVLLALARKCPLLMWEGETCVNLLEQCAPWALDTAVAVSAAQGVVTCLKSLPSGHVEMVHVSEEHPLHMCRHFVACHTIDVALDVGAEDSMCAFYQKLGVILVETICDGDCGPDTACVMLALPRTLANRTALRNEVATYLLDRRDAPWMHDLLVALQELDAATVAAFRSGGVSSQLVELVELDPAPAATGLAMEESSAVAEAQPPAVAGGSHEPESCEIMSVDQSGQKELLDALTWATGIKDLGVLYALNTNLTDWAKTEQLVAYRSRDIVPAKNKDTSEVITVVPALWTSRMRVAAAYHAYLRSGGVPHGVCSAPKGMLKSFVETRLRWPHQPKTAGRNVALWYRSWLANGQHGHESFHGSKNKSAWNRQRAPGFQGTPALVVWVRESLFEWFVSMRYAIDWKKYNDRLRSGGAFKAMGRFPSRMLYDKAKQLLADYCYTMLMAGKRLNAPKIDHRWLNTWLAEFGLTMRLPNRKFKVPKWVLEQRLEIWWLNLARVRALCIEIFGYDPEQENWDQSPFHKNESGSKDGKSLAVAGQIEVPLIEGHSDVRSRWTANLTTFSNKQRILDGELPYAELMFKAEGEVLQKRLQDHIRSGGNYPPWLSVTTAEKGSYKEADVLNFLDTHLSEKPQWRRWRLMQADDFSAHKTPNVSRLAWTRGYVLLIAGGGQTPVTQTCDTDLNQHVRREYTAKESVLILELMRQGMAVPCLDYIACIDIMVDVLSNVQLHLNAAEGYKRTGATVALDGTEDAKIVREAGKFFRDLGMREKINRAVALVKSEVKAGRLKWTYEDVQRLIVPYPKTKYDQVLDNLGDHNHIEADETPYCDGEEPKGDELSDGGSAVAENDGAHTDEATAAVAAEADAYDEPVADALTLATHGGTTAVAVTPANLSVDAADALHQSQTLVAAYNQVIEVMESHGAMPAANQLHNERRKELKRQRLRSLEDPAVAAALVELNSKKAAEARREKLIRENANNKIRKLAALRKETACATELLAKRKRELMNLESVLEAQHTLKRYTPASFGQGKPRSGGAAARKVRVDCLERIAKLGSGLSPSQRTDWAWFHEAWDAKMAGEHAENWGDVFSGWMQKVIDDVGNGVENAFSVFVEAETTRCFGDTPMLVVPFIKGPAVAAK